MIARIGNTITKNDQSMGKSQNIELVGVSEIKDLVHRFKVC